MYNGTRSEFHYPLFIIHYPLPLHSQTGNASVVQWIEFRFPVPTIGVRIPSGAQIRRAARYLIIE